MENAVTAKRTSDSSHVPTATHITHRNFVGLGAAEIPTTIPYERMPGPRPLPLVGNSWRFVAGAWRPRALDGVLWALRRKAGAGGAARVTRLLGHPDLVFPFCADAVARVYRREDVEPHRAPAPSLVHYKRELRKEFFGDEPGLIGVHGPAWTRFRSRVQHSLVPPAAARAAVPGLERVAQDFLDRMDTLRDERGEMPADFLHELYKWALESVGVAALGTRLGCLATEGEGAEDARTIIASIHGFFHSVPELELSAPFWRLFSTKSYRTFVAALDEFRRVCFRHTSGAGGGGACGRVAREQGSSTAAVLALDLLLVGVDTTAAAAASALYLLANNAPAQDTLQRELELLPPPPHQLTPEHLDSMPYLKACIKETLRIKPVILGNGRCLQSDAVVAGYHVPKGTHVVFPHYILSNEERYFPSPRSFVPERWLRSAKAGMETGEEQDRVCAEQRALGVHAFASLPFGFGRRMCPGKRFAETELMLLLAKIFRRYNVGWRHPELTYTVTPTYLPQEPLQFTLTRRPH